MFNYFIFKRKTSGEEVLSNIVDIMLTDKFGKKLSSKTQRKKILLDSTFASFDKGLVENALEKAVAINNKRLAAQKKSKKDEDVSSSAWRNQIQQVKKLKHQ